MPDLPERVTLKYEETLRPALAWRDGAIPDFATRKELKLSLSQVAGSVVHEAYRRPPPAARRPSPSRETPLAPAALG